MQAPPILFFKTFNTANPVYERKLHCPVQQASATIAFRNLHAAWDTPALHKWVNEPYSARYWQLKGYSRCMLQSMFEDIGRKPHYHALIGLYNGKPVCQVDVYHIYASDLQGFLPEASSEDCGIHLLMAPPRDIFKGLSKIMLRAFMDAYFTYPFAGDLYAEPDELNALANRLAVGVGFSFVKKINLPHKMANLYRITKQTFLSQSPLIS